MGVVDLARVLVIDDDVSFRTAVRTALTMDVHDVEEAADGLDGIERFNQHPTDLVIAEMVRPGKGGIIEEIREMSPDVKIIAMSGRDLDALHKSVGSGADHMIEKPIQVIELQETVKLMLGQPL